MNFKLVRFFTYININVDIDTVLNSKSYWYALVWYDI